MGMETYALEEEASSGGSKLDLSRYIAALKKRWWLAALIAVVVTVPWVIFVKQEQPIYEATASIRYRNLSDNAEGYLEDVYEQITSRTFTEQVVSDFGLVADIEQDKDSGRFITRRQVFAKFTSTENPQPGEYVLRLPGDDTFALSLLDQENNEVSVRQGDVALAKLDTVAVCGFAFQLADSPSLPKVVRFTVSSFRSAVESLQGRVGVDFNRSMTIMFVAFRDDDPYIVTQTVNSLAEIFIKKSFVIGKQSQDTRLRMLTAQAEKAKHDFDDVDRRYTEAKRNMGLVGESGLQVVIEQHRSARGELQNLSAQQEALAELLARLKPVESNAAPEEKVLVYKAIAASAVFTNNPTMAITKEQLEGLEREYGKQVSLKAETHPDVVKLRGQIEQLYAKIEDAANSRLASLRREVTSKQSEVGQYSSKINLLPTQQSDLAELDTEWKRKFQTYESIQTQIQELEISSVSEKPAIEILDPAIEPQYPTNRNKAAKAAGGAVVGLLLGLGVVLGTEALDRTIKTVDEAKNTMKLNVLGAIPQITFGEFYEAHDNEKVKMVDQQLVTHDFSPTPIGEAYRSLRTNLLFSKTAGRVQTFVITSMAPGDGKSFTAANLSITMAQQKSNTLLIDTDLRRGVLHNTFGVPKEPGFSNYLMGSILASEIINETHIPNLSVISCGSLIPNPSELLGSVQLRRFLDEMRRRFDLIIFDTPPLNAATDAVVLGTQVDGTVVVIRAGKTKKEIARQKIELFHNVHAKLLGLILNGTSVDLAHEGYSYYHY
ncbi:MAG: polysaccharide biosynthesis tyrosine autokinase [candidate division KSB1 bacterium]